MEGLTRLNMAISGNSIDNNRDETSSLVTEPIPTEWTDEKHGLYLKSMEASFVNQLHHSRDSLAGQFKVLRSGCWKKVKFRKGEAQSNNAESCALLENPWVRHYRSTNKDQAASTSHKATREIKSIHYPLWYSQLCPRDSVGSNEEESAQNFVDEDVKGVDVDGVCSAKRKKTKAADKSSNDQVVPFGKFPENETKS